MGYAAQRAALDRMLAAERAMEQSPTRDGWDAWQRAAADYWVQLHPELARFRRGSVDATPTVEELRERAGLLATAMDGVPGDWRLRKPSPERVQHLARVGWFHELSIGLYEPVWGALERLRSGDASRIETLIRFLEADVYCFGSGYLKADLIRSMTRSELGEAEVARLRRVVLAVVGSYDRREFRAYCRLARRLDSPSLREDLRALAASDDRRTARHARWVLDALGEG